MVCLTSTQASTTFQNGVTGKSTLRTAFSGGENLSLRQRNTFARSTKKSRLQVSAIAGPGKFYALPIGTPRVPYRTPGEGGWQWVDLWNVLYRERIIFIAERIEEEFCNQILTTMLYLDSVENTKPLYLFINCPGGDVSPCLTLYDTMQHLKSSIGTVTRGYAFDMACLLAASGVKDQRICYPLSEFAIQTPTGAARGMADDIQNEAKELSRVRAYFCEQFALKTGQPVEKVTEDLLRVKRFSAQEAIEYGVVDRIVRQKSFNPDDIGKNRSARAGKS